MVPTFEVTPEEGETFSSLVQEFPEFRLAAYAERAGLPAPEVPVANPYGPTAHAFLGNVHRLNRTDSVR